MMTAARSSTETRTSTMGDVYTPVYYIGFVGDHGMGKTTFADNMQEYLQETGLVHVLRINMADDLRDRLRHALPTRVDNAIKRHPLERPTLQYVGESWRIADKNHWVSGFLTQVQQSMWQFEDLPAKPVVVIVADTYNLNELPLMNGAVFLRDTSVDTPLADALEDIGEDSFHGYVAETIRSTQFMLRNPELLADMIDGPVVLLQGSNPAALGSLQNLEYAVEIFLQDLNQRQRMLGFDGWQRDPGVPSKTSSLNTPQLEDFNVLQYLPLPPSPTGAST